MESTENVVTTESVEENIEVVEDTENSEVNVIDEVGGTESDSGSVESVQASITVEEVEAVVDSALEEYFGANTIQVVVVEADDGGLNKSLENLTFVEICLLGIFLILLGRSILHIIGGRAWNK